MNDNESALSLDRSNDGDRIVLCAAGEIDSSNCGSLESLLGTIAVERATPQVDIDLGEVTFIDSSGLRALIVGQRAIVKAGGTLRITSASSSVRRLFEITGLAGQLGLVS
jgi:anti-anti-sigma factor